MMNDLISRQAAMDVCDNAIDLWHGQLGEGIVIAVKKKIEELPSAEPKRNKGEWMMHSDYPDRFICSECGAQFDVWHWESKQMHFCPNCGADMRGE